MRRCKRINARRKKQLTLWILSSFPAKIFKGLLYESAVEIFEIFELAEMKSENLAEPEIFFHKFSDNRGNVLANRYIQEKKSRQQR